MKIVSANCPNCQAALRADSRFCSHCGTPVIVDDEATRVKYTYQEVDDARIKEADVRENIRLRELEIELLKLQNESRHKKDSLRLRIAVLAFFLLVLLVLIVGMLTAPGDDIFVSCFLLGGLALIIAAIIIPKTFKNL